MSRFPHKDLPVKKSDHSKTKFESKQGARLGSKKSPAQLSVQTSERESELLAIFAENDWYCNISIDAEVDEDIRDLTFLQNKQGRAVSTKQAQRNDPCPCGSGKKYKKCCVN